MKPSRRSALAPSDGGFFFGPGSFVASASAATCALTVIAEFLPSPPAAGRGGSRDQALRLQGVVQLTLERGGRPGGIDSGGREHRVRDVDRDHLVDRRLRPPAGVFQS